MSQRPDISTRTATALPRVRRRRRLLGRIVCRWVPAAVALAIAVGYVADVQQRDAARQEHEQPAPFFSIQPCRLRDTRAELTAHGRRRPLGPNQVVPVQVTGINGGCAIPPTATGVALVVTALDGTASSFVAVSPGETATRPIVRDVSWSAGQQPASRTIDVELGPAGDVQVYNAAGTVDIVIDVVGYAR